MKNQIPLLPTRGLLPGLFLAFAAAVSACASGSSSDGPPSLEELRVEGEGLSTVGMEDVRIWRDEASVNMAVEAPADEVLQAVPAVYRALEIPIAVHDIDRGIVGNPSWQPRRILGERPTRHFRCGSGNSLTGHAASYGYEISVETRIRVESEKKTFLETRAGAIATPRSVTGSEVRCVSRQRLEQAINGAVLGALVRAEEGEDF